jgi:hypothetical protein
VTGVQTCALPISKASAPGKGSAEKSPEDANLQQAAQTADLAGKAQALTRGTQQVVSRGALLAVEVSALLRDFDSTARAFEVASEAYDRARRSAGTASEGFAQAEEDYRVAERDYRWMAYVLIISAAIEAGDALCASAQSTTSYRAELCQVQRICLPPDQHIDHAFPHALGGANVPDNYQVMAAAENEALGASFWEKFATTPIPVLKGMIASALMRLRCPNGAAAWSR